MGFLPKMIKTYLLALCIIIIAPYNVNSITYQCDTVQNYDSLGRSYCVFRGVQYSSNTSDIAFEAPAEPVFCVAFENSQMEHLPREFTEQFENGLKVLNVTGCNLKSVVVTESMEELIAIDNHIEKIIVQQSTQNNPLKELHLQSNNISDISNITKHCKNLRILDLSGNTKLVTNGALDLSVLNGLDQLEYLSLANVEALYINSDKEVSLPKLTLLDLSVNNLLPVDLRVNYFQSFKSLEILRLNSNGFGQLDYNYLTQIDSLKQVYLEGNEFSCTYLKTMIRHLNDHGKQTPVANPASQCPAGYSTEHQMCCKSDSLGQADKTSRPPTTTSTHESSTQSSITTPTKETVIPSVYGSAACFGLNLQIALGGFMISLFWMWK